MEPTSSSLSLCDLFLLDTGAKIYVFPGIEAEALLGFYGVKLANEINQKERNNEAKIIDFTSRKKTMSLSLRPYLFFSSSFSFLFFVLIFSFLFSLSQSLQRWTKRRLWQISGRY